MARAGANDLTVQAQIRSQDEIGQLAASFNEMIRSQALVVGMVNQAALELAASSEALAASSEEVTATAGEVSRNIRQVGGRGGKRQPRGGRHRQRLV